MIHNCQIKKVTVVQLGDFNAESINQALYRANQDQSAFHFSYEWNVRLPLDEKYKLPNGGYDLCGAVEKLLKSKKYKNLPRPLLIVSKEPMGDPDNPNEPDDFYSYSQEDEYDPLVSILSTYDIPVTQAMERYILMMLSMYILSVYGNLAYHRDRKGCVLAYLDETETEENCWGVSGICNDCEATLQKRMRRNEISIESVAAAMKLLNKALGHKYCFLVMPFAEKFNLVHKVIYDTLSGSSWVVKRADEITYPKLITDLIYKEILTSDLVVADLTGLNANVIYEVGLTHAVGSDLILLSQDKEIPFDLKNEQTIFYSMEEVAAFKESLKRCAGSGSPQDIQDLRGEAISLTPTTA